MDDYNYYVKPISALALDQFELDPLTGDIKVAVNMSLDREENEFFILNLTVNNTRPGVNCVINSDCKYIIMLFLHFLLNS